jgi:hypothetical protein
MSSPKKELALRCREGGCGAFHPKDLAALAKRQDDCRQVGVTSVAGPTHT